MQGLFVPDLISIVSKKGARDVRGSDLQQNKVRIQYPPHKALAEVAKDKGPIGRECADLNWIESQLMTDQNKLGVK